MSRRAVTLPLALVAFLAAVLIVPGALPRAQDVAPAGAVQAAAHASNLPRRQVLIVSRVSRRAASHQPRLEAFADWLAIRLKDTGIEAGAGLVAPSSREMVQFLREGRVDVVSESVLSALIYEEKAGAELLMHEWRDGQPYYQTVFITRRDSRIFALRDLSGRRIAFEDRGSTSSFLLPMATLIAAGLKPVALAGNDRPVPAGHVGYVFAGSEANIAAWTANGLVDAGAFSNFDWDRERVNPARYREKMRMYYITQPLLRSVLLVRKGLPPTVRAALIRTLGTFATSPDAAAARAAYYDVAQFVPLAEKASRDLEEARALYRVIRPLLD